MLGATTVLLLSGPSDFSVDLINSTSFTVNVVPLSGNPAVLLYDVSIESASSTKNECRIKSTERPLRCLFSGLTASTQYSIRVKACLKVYGGCGQYLEKTVTTPTN